MENEENKKYTYEGTVQISSREYRDLIEELAEAKADQRKTDSRYWEMSSQVRKAEEQLKKATEELDVYKKFVASSIEISQAFWKFRFESSKEKAGSDE